MRFLHHAKGVLSHLCSFLTVIEEGSLHRAAVRLRVSQPALSRQMQALEAELGGRLLERTSTGVRPTRGGLALVEKAQALISLYQSTFTDVRRLLRGEMDRLRIGYMPSATRQYLNPALQQLQTQFPETSWQLLDLSPGEQIKAMRAGELDVAITDASGAVLAKEFYTRTLAVVPSLVALPSRHRLAKTKKIHLADLKNEAFVSGSEAQVPGHNRQLAKYCRKLGRFTPKWSGGAQTLDESFALVANEGAVAIVPVYMSHHVVPGLTLLPLADSEVTWQLVVVWQRGKTGGALGGLLEALFQPAVTSPGIHPRNVPSPRKDSIKTPRLA
ncbi:MAG TPA: LysR family transcriptional regulator [Opitutaceae bacterium]|nr:LysR family transcriptional regulator [Opitutaceae bacterium]